MRDLSIVSPLEEVLGLIRDLSALVDFDTPRLHQSVVLTVGPWWEASANVSIWYDHTEGVDLHYDVKSKKWTWAHITFKKYGKYQEFQKGDLAYIARAIRNAVTGQLD